MLESLSYRNVLKRGYALVRDEAGLPVKTAAAVSAGQRLNIAFHDGAVDAVVGEGDGTPACRARARQPAIGGRSPARRRSRRQVRAPPNQGACSDGWAKEAGSSALLPIQTSRTLARSPGSALP